MSQGKFRIIIDKKAREMLVAHTKFLAKVSKPAARALRAKFAEAALSLSENPERFPWLLDSELPFNQYRKLRFDERYLIIFSVTGNTVSIGAVVDCREDYGRYLGWMVN
jgi:plasmid stabilization system protein ParE